MAGVSPHPGDSKQLSAAMQLSPRLKSCWELDIDWKFIPKKLNEACHQAAKAMSMPATSILAGLLFIVSFSMSHSVVKVVGTDWVEPVLVWMSICMPTGCGKSSLCKYLRNLIQQARSLCRKADEAPWLLDDQSFEKLGELMEENHGKLLGLYDELPMFLSQLNICRGRALSDSPQVAIFLQLYGGDRWVRRTVSGDSNFSMNYTGLTIGGFTQPSVARGLIEYAPNVEKGLCQRFLWLLPKPEPTLFKDLQCVDSTFSTAIVNLMSAQWKPGKDIHQWTISTPCDAFEKKYDSITEKITKLSSMDDLLSGMLSKSKGQILRVAAAMHVLFHWEEPQNIPNEISEAAITASINFVDVCIQHAAYLAGRGEIQEAIDSFEKMLSAQPNEGDKATSDGFTSARLSLTLPGSVLNMTALIYLKKFRYTGNKSGGLCGWKMLEKAGLGSVVKSKALRGTDKPMHMHKAPLYIPTLKQGKLESLPLLEELYEFKKREIPDDSVQKEEMMKKLIEFKVTFAQYKNAFEMDNVTMSSIHSAKAGSRSPRTSSPRKRKKGKTTSRKQLNFESDEEEEEKSSSKKPKSQQLPDIDEEKSD